MSDRRREDTGRSNYLAGQAAEEAVLRHYEARGLTLAKARWRGKAGEVDLILRDGDELVFVEVKHSRSFEGAAARLLPKQVERLMRAAEEFAGGEPKGLLTEMRFDVALVNGQGEVHILENALW
ncbi:MAG: YraN family protein [Shimia sp.]|uniref:YraN family protein n=1 Tax=Shimia sp. TaxID=1954381 RepID=UPI001B2C8622|nr:YraN family protein [Shimia sp.]MBO6896104.1 YraN family protein [Shimia sp.]